VSAELRRLPISHLVRGAVSRAVHVFTDGSPVLPSDGRRNRVAVS
jgi:hypothetical protein